MIVLTFKSPSKLCHLASSPLTLQEKRGQLKEKVLIVLFDSMKLSCDPVCSILLTSRLPVQLAVDVQVNYLPLSAFEYLRVGKVRDSLGHRTL